MVFFNRFKKLFTIQFIIISQIAISQTSYISTFDEIAKVYVNPSGAYFGISTSGGFVAWGLASAGGVLTDEVKNLLMAEVNNGDYVVQVESTKEAFTVLFSSGVVITWGSEDQTCIGDRDDCSNRLTGVKKIYDNGNSFLVEKIDGTLQTWGNPSYGGDIEDGGIFDPENREIVKVVTNDNAYAVLFDDGSVVSWGDIDDIYYPYWISDNPYLIDSGVTKLFAYGFGFMAVGPDLEPTIWGESYLNDDLSTLTLENYSEDIDYTFYSGNYMDYISAAAVLSSEGRVFTWGSEYFGNSSSVSSILNDPDHGQIKDLKITYGFSPVAGALTRNNEFLIWGDDDDEFSSYTGIVNNVSDFYSNKYAFALLLDDGSVTTFGDSDYGGVVPTGTTGIKKIYANDWAFAALNTNDELTVWGDELEGGLNNSGKSLNNIVQVYSSPKEVETSAFAALNTSNELIVWGGFSGVLTPPTDTSVVEVYVATGSFSVLYSDGTLQVIDASNEYNISETETLNDSSVSPPVVTNIHTNGNTIFYDKTPELYGTAEPWSTIIIKDSSGNLIASNTRTQQDGRWYTNVNELGYGNHTLIVESWFPSRSGESTITFQIKKRPNSFEATLPNGHEIEAYKYNIRETGFKLFSWDGNNLSEINADESSTYRGRIKNIPNSKIVLSWYPNGDWFISELYDKGGSSINNLRYNITEASNYQEINIPFNDTDGGASKAKYHFDAGFSSYWDLMQKMLNGDPERGTRDESEWNIGYNIEDGLTMYETWINLHDYTMTRDLNLSLSLQSLVLPVKPTNAPSDGWNTDQGRFSPRSHLKNLGVTKTTYVEDNGSGITLDNVYVHPDIPVSPMWWFHYDGGGLAGPKEWDKNYRTNYVNINKWGSGTGAHEIGHSLGLGHYNTCADAMGGGGMNWFGRDSRERATEYLDEYPRLKIDATYSDPVHPYANDLYGTAPTSGTLSFDITNINFDSNGESVVLKDVSAYSLRGGTVTMTSSTQFRYTPPENFKGKDEFGYIIKSGSGTNEFNSSGIVYVDVHDSNSLVVHYGFDETDHSVINNLSFQGKTTLGTFVGDRIKDVTTSGIVSNALELDGRTGILLNDLVDPLDGSQTTSLWIKPTDLTTGVIYDTGAKTSTNKSGISINIKEGNINFYVNPEGLTEDEGIIISKPLSSADLRNDGWANIALVIDRNNSNSSVSAYWNGNLIESKAISSTAIIKGKTQYGIIPSSIGFLADGNADFNNLQYGLNGGFKGLVDEFKVFNYALSSSEIQSLYNDTPSNTAPSQSTVDGLFNTPILNGSFEGGRPLIGFLKKDWNKFGSTAKKSRALYSYNGQESEWTTNILPNINALDLSFLELRKVNWSSSSGVFQQIGYFKSALKFHLRLKTATKKSGEYAGLKVSLYAGGSPIYNELALNSSEYDNSYFDAPVLLDSWIAESGSFSNTGDFIELRSKLFDMATISGIDENTPLSIQFETTSSSKGNTTFLDDIELILSNGEDPNIESILLNSDNTGIEIIFSEDLFADFEEGIASGKISSSNFNFTLNSSTATLTNSNPISFEVEDTTESQGKKYILGFGLNGTIANGDSITLDINPVPFDIEGNSLTFDQESMTLFFTVNNAPTVTDVAKTTNEDTAVEITLTGSDIDEDSLTFSTGEATNGTVSLDGAVATYTPNANFNGTDSFTYTANDGTTDSAEATITVTVSAVNDIPTVADVAVSTTEDTAVEITLTGSDIDEDSLTFSIGEATNGTVSLDGAVATYTPNANFNGTDSFTYTANDGTTDSAEATITVTVSAVNDLPTVADVAVSTTEDTAVEITLTGSDIDEDSLTFSIGEATNGTVSLDGAVATYTPNANFNGTDSFTYTANDGTTDSTEATITVTVTAVLNVDDEVYNNSIRIFPNPTKDILFLEGNKNTVEISIYDLLGKKVISKMIANSINVRELTKGVYLIIISDRGHRFSFKFIKN
jgi:hypothetical protein